MYEEEFDEEYDEDERDGRTDAVLLALGEMIEAVESRTAIINPRRMAQMERCYDLIQTRLLSPGAELSYRVHEPYKSMGCIILEADNYIISQPNVFRQACKLADSVEIYPLVNGKLRIEFGFDCLTIPIE